HPWTLLPATVGKPEPRRRDVLRGGAPRAGLSRGNPPAGRDPADSRPSGGGPALRSVLVRVAHVLGLSSPWPPHRDPSGPRPYDRGVRLGRSSAESPTAAGASPKTEVFSFGCTDGRESIAWNAHLGRHPVRVAGRRSRIAREVELPILARGDPEVQPRRDA